MDRDNAQPAKKGGRKWLWLLFGGIAVVAIAGVGLTLVQPDWPQKVASSYEEWQQEREYARERAEYEASKADRPAQSARTFVREYASRYGQVFDCSQISNGAYMGFPDGKGIETFQLSVFPAGGSRGRTLIIAVRPDGREWDVVKKDYN